MTKHPPHVHYTGFRKVLLYGCISIHVAARFAGRVFTGRLGPLAYLRFLRRAAIFLWTVRHGKAVRRGRWTKIHLYVPAYPSPAFFRLLEKLLSPDPAPGTVVLSMTRACRYRCPHCYQKKDGGKDLPVERLVAAADAMQNLGVCLFDIEGGEPLLKPDRLRTLLGALRDDSEAWINTTGDGATPERIEELMGLGLFGVMVSLHAPDAEDHDAFTGIPGSFDQACRTLRAFREAGAFTAVNCCPGHRATVEGDLERLIERARDLQCDFVQVIHAKPSGGWLGEEDRVPGEAAVAVQRSLHRRYNGGGKHLAYPSVSAQVFEEDPRRFGCTAGGVDRFYVGASGEVQPCEFLNVSFGSVVEENFETVYRRMRQAFRTPQCSWLCCTRARSIREAAERAGTTRLPLPWSLTRTIIGTWDDGPPTRLYRSLGLYDPK